MTMRRLEIPQKIKYSGSGNIRVSMCVSVYVLLYICMCVYVRTYVCMHVCIYVCIYVCKPSPLKGVRVIVILSVRMFIFSHH